MNLQFLADADSVTLDLEHAKNNLEASKAAFELAKKAYDEMLARSEDEGFPKAKLKKITEERIQSLRDSGLLESTAIKSVAKDPRPKKPKLKTENKNEDADNDLDAALDTESVEQIAEV